MSYFLGIDPGLSGALAFYDPKRDALNVYDMPTYTIASGGKQRRKMDLHQLAQTMHYYAPNTRHAIIEEVGAMPGQGVTSMFSFGFSAGAVQMAVVASSIRFEMVTPRVWKGAMKLKTNKDESRRLASRLMPNHAHLWSLVKHDGRAEAALLAYYLSEQEGKPIFPDLQRNGIEGML